MKKCMKCKVVFNSDYRTRCLYCDTILMPADPGDLEHHVALFSSDEDLIEQVVKNRKLLAHDTMRYLVGSYFKARTFNFMYMFSRNEFKMGKHYKRFLVQPLNLSSFLMLPWVVIDFWDSLILRFLYNGYCRKCDCKYLKVFGGDTEHDPKECEYNIEYRTLLHQVLSGRITQTEENFKQQAERKVQEGKKSAYWDLCTTKGKFDSVVDVACIWFSSGLIVFAIAWLALPVTIRFVSMID